jgi:hypothetical protein
MFSSHFCPQHVCDCLYGLPYSLLTVCHMHTLSDCKSIYMCIDRMAISLCFLIIRGYVIHPLHYDLSVDASTIQCMYLLDSMLFYFTAGKYFWTLFICSGHVTSFFVCFPFSWSLLNVNFVKRVGSLILISCIRVLITFFSGCLSSNLTSSQLC